MSTYPHRVPQMDKSFVIANIQLFLERFAYYAARTAFILVLFGPVEYGGLGLTSSNEKLFFTVLTILTVFLPIVLGRLSDAIGPRKAMMSALGLDLIGFVLLCLTPTLSSGHFTLAMIASVCIGLGSALFFPTTYGRIVQNLTPQNLSVGLGIALLSVNLGSFLGPLSVDIGIGGNTFAIPIYIAAAVTFLNLLISATCTQSRVQANIDASTEQKEKKSPVLKSLFTFLCILGLFSFVEAQLNAHNTGLYQAVSESLVLAHSSNIILVALIGFLGPFCIIPLAWFSSKFKRQNALLCSMAAISLGGLLTGLSGNIIVNLTALLLVTLGGFLYTIKMFEYIAIHAPANRKATYMGFAKIPAAIAYLLGMIPLYELMTGVHPIGFWGVCFGLGIIFMVITAIFLKKHPTEDGI